MARDFIVDLDNGTFARSFTDPTPVEPGALFRGDIRTSRLFFCRRTGIFGRPFDFVDYSAATSIKFAIGDREALPTSGTFTLTFDGSTSSALNFDATAAEVETAINALAGDPTGGVTVTKPADGVWVVAFAPPGVRNLFTGDDTGISPLSELLITRQTTGTVSVEEVQVIQLAVVPPVSAASWTALDTTVTESIVETVAGTSTANAVQTITLDVEPASGDFVLVFPEDTRAITAAVVAGVFTTTAAHGLAVGQEVVFASLATPVNVTNGITYFVSERVSTTAFKIAATSGGTSITTATADAGSATVTMPAKATDRIAFNATATAVQSALQNLSSIGSGNASVTKVSAQQYIVSFRGEKGFADLPLFTMENFLSGPIGFIGQLDLSTEPLRRLFDSSVALTLTAEVQVEIEDQDANAQTLTVAQSDAVLTRDLIQGTGISPQPAGSGLEISRGGTGATTAAGARTNLAVPGLATANTFTENQTISRAVQALSRLIASDAAIDTKQHQIVALTNGNLEIILANDASSIQVAWLRVTRSGTTATGIELLAPIKLGSASSTPITSVLTTTATLDFPSISSGGSADLTITLTGAQVGDVVILGEPAVPAVGLIFNAFVSATNTVTVRASDVDPGPVDAISATFRVCVIRF